MSLFGKSISCFYCFAFDAPACEGDNSTLLVLSRKSTSQISSSFASQLKIVNMVREIVEIKSAL